MCFQLYLHMQVVKISLHSIFATSVNTIHIKQDYKIHARYIIGCFIVWNCYYNVQGSNIYNKLRIS